MSRPKYLEEGNKQKQVFHRVQAEVDQIKSLKKKANQRKKARDLENMYKSCSSKFEICQM